MREKKCKYAFVILHYIALEETLECISSIKRMQNQELIKIVVVDNASPNKSGKHLLGLYENDEQVHIILNEKNEGFSRGNNIGCDYAKEYWEPEFYVVTNNDIVFSQKDFCDRIKKEYKKSQFYVLGMDIYCERKAIHQSPLADSIPSIYTINKTIIFNWLAIMFFDLFYVLLKIYFKKNENSGYSRLNYDKYQKNVCVMGACLVFSSDYMEERGCAFEPETQFYYEEYLLTYWCQENEKLIVYQPEIKVIHAEGTATENYDKEYKKKILFRMRNILESAKIYRDVLKGLDS